ncbi:hypothetical protein BD311DRAFT_866926 [Dichomitus squalens]|uniref:Uroporphyrinogen decarboxylase (URO-D) domain-containing protein n=1 Tax=Dichomitus squalens TaxID=114155 RepID=A0A4Q9MG22_9APHY|nr:hypothetical protein BD311DRAFT_866926 [Dichomitus squalens]
MMLSPKGANLQIAPCAEKAGYNWCIDKVALQGNPDPNALQGGRGAIEREVKRMAGGFRGGKKAKTWIANWGRGIPPCSFHPQTMAISVFPSGTNQSRPPTERSPKEELAHLSIQYYDLGLEHRDALDGNAALKTFCEELEAACVEVIDQDGVMTKDLALAIHGKEMKREHCVVTDVYMDKINEKLKQKLAARAKL